jgi:hypothetical protein
MREVTSYPGAPLGGKPARLANGDLLASPPSGGEFYNRIFPEFGVISTNTDHWRTFLAEEAAAKTIQILPPAPPIPQQVLVLRARLLREHARAYGKRLREKWAQEWTARDAARRLEGFSQARERR